MQLASCRLVSGGEGIGEREMEMDEEVGSAVGDMTLVGALVKDPQQLRKPRGQGLYPGEVRERERE